ncbi:hypothetical protein [Xylella fastidiosa]|uniref:Uncharacterized protein n=1 Tax=Xylella fastidiosa subsp. sandyi Ann-1 TaxID=155920 RepID=A0A060H6Q5_XYLFS|nr:hypothetical protein [Xylella fastidiosa]AIC11278.1 hypothetical protein D934_07240 [Xylella fastidiosa subsp. sandyi Ann-1]UIX81950.1 hypothetical protein LZ756_03525 [Xylella fastidiosa subsp. sandyi]
MNTITDLCDTALQTKPPPSINNSIDRKDCSSTATLALATPLVGTDDGAVGHAWVNVHGQSSQNEDVTLTVACET